MYLFNDNYGCYIVVVGLLTDFFWKNQLKILTLHKSKRLNHITMDLVLPYDDSVRLLPFYLAQEEWLAAKFPQRDFFFIWQVEPTVIIGRNQLLQSEVNVDYCNRNGIRLVRRKSGGGAVLADMNNIMFSYITSSSSVTTTFSAYTSMVAASLRMLGLDASDNSRNDILIGERKVSGNSYYHTPGRSIVHGTMLYDYDGEMMANALTPPAVKLQSHGVASIRSRVTTIREQLPSLSMDDFKKHIISTIPDSSSSLRLSSDDIKEIEAIEKEYYRPEWLSGKNPKGTLLNSARFDGVGTVTVHLTVSHDVIREVELTGDYLEISDVTTAVASKLIGVAYERHSISAAFGDIDLKNYIPGLDSDQLLSLII